MEPLRITLGGNATVLIECGPVRVVTDPWLTERIGPWRRLRPARLTAADVAAATAVLISHAHPDHLDRESLAALPRDTPVLTPGGTPYRVLIGAGFRNVVARTEWEAWSVPGLRILAVPSVHTRWSLGFVVEVGGRRVYFAGDAGPYTPFGAIGERCGPLDVALMPVGGSSLALGRLQRHLTPEVAARATCLLNPAVTIPIHWGVVPCVPAALDRFRGTAGQYVEIMAKQCPGVRIACPEEGTRTEF